DNTTPTASALNATNAFLSPNNSAGTLDTTTFVSTITDANPGNWTLTITNSGNAVRPDEPRTGKKSNPGWNGKRTGNDGFVPNGLYTATVTYADQAGNVGASTSTTVTVDNSTPSASALNATSAFLSPSNSSGILDSTNFASTITDANPGNWTLTITDSGNAV